MSVFVITANQSHEYFTKHSINFVQNESSCCLYLNLFLLLCYKSCIVQLVFLILTLTKWKFPKSLKKRKIIDRSSKVDRLCWGTLNSSKNFAENPFDDVAKLCYAFAAVLMRRFIARNAPSCLNYGHVAAQCATLIFSRHTFRLRTIHVVLSRLVL